MPIPSLAWFQEKTKLDKTEHFFTSHRGSSISKIDSLVTAYHKKPFHDLEAKAKVLSAILAECARWLKAKAGKSGISASIRRKEIQELAKSAFGELKVNLKVSETDRFNLNKSGNVGRGFELKPLHGGYGLERTGYEQSSQKKSERQSPLWGPGILGAHQTGTKNIKQITLTPIQINYMQEILKKDWNQLTLLEAEDLGKIWGVVNEREMERVQFLHKTERSEYFVVYKGDKYDFETPKGAPYDTSDGLHQRYMYAVDEYANLFVSKPSQGKNGMRWNHSSFNAGKAVLCAGLMSIIKGEIRFIDSLSGHYKPGRTQLHGLMKLFNDEGVNLKNAEVLAYAGPGKDDRHTRMEIMPAISFLANRDQKGEEHQVLTD